MKTGRSGMKRTLRGAYLLTVLMAASLLSPLSMSAASGASGKTSEPQVSLPDKKPASTAKTPSSSQKQPAVKTVEPETMLQGVFYDLKLMRNRQPNKDFPPSADGSFQSEYVTPSIRILRNFVNGDWRKTTDANGRVSYTELSQYYCSPTRLWKSYFYIPATSSKNAPQFFSCEKDVKPGCWIVIYSGYVVAPFTGRFRFVGFGDDFMVVRFDQKLVFDYGRFSATLGKPLSTELRSSMAAKAGTSQQSRNPIDRKMPTARGETNPLYSRIKLEYRSTDYPTTNSEYGGGLAYGSYVDVRKGDVYPIEILLSDFSDNFCFYLFLEREEADEKKTTADASKQPPLLLFTTSSDVPDLKTLINSFSPSTAIVFEKDSPAWRIVDSRGRTIPSHIPPAKQTAGTAEKQPAASTAGTAEKQPAASTAGTTEKQAASTATSQVSSAQTRQPSRKEAYAAKKGNKTTLRIMEYDGDTTIETVITSEPSGKNLIRTKQITETKNGEVVRTESASRTAPKKTNQTAAAEVKREMKALILKTRGTQSGSSRSSSPFGVADPREADEARELDEMLDDLFADGAL